MPVPFPAPLLVRLPTNVHLRRRTLLTRSTFRRSTWLARRRIPFATTLRCSWRRRRGRWRRPAVEVLSHFNSVCRSAHFVFNRVDVDRLDLPARDRITHNQRPHL